MGVSDKSRIEEVGNLSKVISENIVVSFPEAVRDNVVSSDVTITSSLRSDVIILGINLPFS